MHEATVEQAGEQPRRRRRWLPWAAAGTALLLVGGSAAWWLFWSARLAWPAEDPGAFGVSVPSAGEVRRWTFADTIVCLEGADTAVVDAIEVEAGNAEVTDFAVRPRPERAADGITYLFGDRPGRLADTDFGSRERTVHGTCGRNAYVEVAVELTRPAQETARADGLVIHWSAGLRSGSLHVPAHLVLCAEPDPASPRCRSIP